MSHAHPPHLPPKPSSVGTPSYRISMYVAMLCISLTAGGVGALMMFAWFAPVGYFDQGVLVRGQSYSSSFVLTGEPETSIARRIKNNTVEVFVYDALGSSTGYYPERAHLGTGVMLSSNGWGAVHISAVEEKSLTPATLSIRDVQGVWYTPTAVVIDNEQRIIYFKLTGNEFYVVSFPDWRAVQKGLEVYVYDKGLWRKQLVADTVRIDSASSFDAYDERMRTELAPTKLTRGAVFADSGYFLGFVDAYGRLLDAWMIEYTIPSLLESGVVSTHSSQWRGYVVEGVDEGKMVYGFVLESVNAAQSSLGLRKNDIIRAINGVPISEKTLYRMMRDTPLTLSVWRDGKMFDILMP